MKAHIVFVALPALLSLTACGTPRGIKESSTPDKVGANVVVQKLPDHPTPTATTLPAAVAAPEPKLDFVSHFTKEAERVTEGAVDNVVMSQIPHGKQSIFVTSVGFSSGEGISLLGIHAGIGKGKSLRITANFVDVIGGVEVFRLNRLVAVAEHAPQPAPESTPKAEIGTATEVAKP